MAERSARKGVTRRALLRGAGGLIAAVAFDGLLVEPHALRLERVEVPVKGLAPEFDGFRIAHLSDFHYPLWISRSHLKRARDLALSFRPHAILLTGDYVDGKAADVCPDLTPVLDGLAADDGVYSTRGNHDHWLDPDGVAAELGRLGTTDLENRSIVLSAGGGRLALAGLGDLWEGTVDFTAALGDVAPDVPRVVLCHNPDVAETTPEGVRIDLMLSGHTHGGQVYIPFYGAPNIPSRYGQKYRCGLVHGPHHRVYVTRGVGALRPVRFLCPPEVTAITLRAV